MTSFYDESIVAPAMRLRGESDEVLYPDQEIVAVSGLEIAMLKARAAANRRKRARLCMHLSASETLHEMLIVLGREEYVRPHRHHAKSESFSILEGEADVVLFDDHGQVVKVLRMGSKESNEVYYYRLSQPIYHTVLVRSDWLVFHEVTNGPFVREQTSFAPWAPEDTDVDLRREFVARLRAEKSTGLQHGIRR